MGRVWLCVLCGVPGAGKTSLAESLCQSLQDLSTLERPPSQSGERDEVWHIEVDKLEYGEKFSPEAWKRARSEAKGIVDVLLDSSPHCLGSSTQRTLEELPRQAIKTYHGSRSNAPHGGALRVVLLDDDHVYRSMRKYYASRAAKNKSYLSFIVLAMPPLEECMHRRQSSIPAGVLRDIYSKFELPGDEFWERNTVFAEANSSWRDLELKYLPAPVSPLQGISKVPHSMTPAHRLDLALRQAVSGVVKANLPLGGLANVEKRKLAKDSGLLDIAEAVEDDLEFLSLVEARLRERVMR
mmetsp:Transcript_34886/g.137859  ORF Transcript_34886/g.137859 Transcript_34886/m.137859 type:complete len:297 (-) Transcript_34886:993-1883(-)|eukprot:CAMPEP_0113970852 /NCGR_PEP_ID=MMETSP0011_2-20120614/11630_1 /TAXON_ID=101924 /ORGANISM="Rhodosorus marinus" /LENGTH=296 /DNA_ID=CAMNT_0000985721 /DNA_START=49 /DNA_END=939 /DNA_ORIENTATION=- /assembly_acc=CAM_ASM_000156